METVLDRPYKLQFIPAVLDADDKTTNSSTTIKESTPEIESFITVGGKDIQVARSPAFRCKSASADGDNPCRIAKRAVSLDLAPYLGKPISFLWRMASADAGLTGAILSVKFLPAEFDRASRPPILMICSDAHRYDHAFGEAGRRLMPRLQEFAKNAVVYQRAYSAASWTLPSLVSLFTGLNPLYHQTGIRVAEGERSAWNPQNAPPGTFTVFRGSHSYSYTRYHPDLTTLFEVLQDQGYALRMVAANPLYFLSGLAADGGDISVFVDDEGDKVNRAAFNLMTDLSPDRPPFMLIHYMDVHQYTVWKYQRRYPGKDYTAASREELLPCYAEAVADCDRYLGELLDQWNKSIGLDRSLVIFFADHGEHFREEIHPVTLVGDEDQSAPYWNRPITHGNTMDDLLLHVPLAVQYPAGMGPHAKEEESPVSLTDLFPTILELLKAPADFAPLAGRSLLRISPENEQKVRPFFADYQLTGPDLASVRLGSWKLIINRTASKEALIHLSNLRTVPSEAQAEENDANRARQLRQIYDEYVRRADQATRGRPTTLAPSVANQEQLLNNMKALGYIR